MNAGTSNRVAWQAEKGTVMTVAELRAFIHHIDAMESVTSMNFDAAEPKVRIKFGGGITSIYADGGKTT